MREVRQLRVPRVYVDTSVFGGLFDEEFARVSETFFEAMRARAGVV